MHSGLEGLRVSNKPMMAHHFSRLSISGPCGKTEEVSEWNLLDFCCYECVTTLQLPKLSSTEPIVTSIVHKPVSKRASKWKPKGWEWLPMRLCLLKTRDFSATSSCSFTRKLSKKQRTTYQHLQAPESWVGWQSTLWGKQAFCASKLKGHHRFQLQCL